MDFHLTEIRCVPFISLYPSLSLSFFAVYFFIFKLNYRYCCCTHHSSLVKCICEKSSVFDKFIKQFLLFFVCKLNFQSHLHACTSFPLFFPAKLWSRIFTMVETKFCSFFIILAHKFECFPFEGDVVAFFLSLTLSRVNWTCSLDCKLDANKLKHM